MDGELEKVEDKLHLIAVNICSKNDYVSKIEQKIHHVKKQCHCIKADMGIPILPDIIMFMNAYPNDQGISFEFSP